jgi:hypothetical protein
MFAHLIHGVIAPQATPPNEISLVRKTLLKCIMITTVQDPINRLLSAQIIQVAVILLHLLEILGRQILIVQIAEGDE